jgi:Flp pilus assembly protein TadG
MNDQLTPPTECKRGAFSRMRTAFKRLAGERSGVSAAEFALVVPAFLLLVVETLQLGLYFYISASLDHATSDAARQILTGAVGQAGLTATQFRTQVLCPALPGSMSCANIVTNVLDVPEATSPNGFYTYLNTTQTGIAPPSMNNALTSFCPGSTGSYVYIQVYYAMPVLSPIWMAAASVTWNGSTVHFVSASAAFKNEPFQSTGTGC